MFFFFFASMPHMGNNWRIDQRQLPKNVGSCPGHHLELIVRNLVFKIFRGDPPPH